MNFSEATKLLKEGHGIRRKSWPDCSYVKIEVFITTESEEVPVIKHYRQEIVPFVYDNSIILSDDWVVVGEEDNIIDFPSAMEKLRYRYKVKPKEWDKNTYIALDQGLHELNQYRMCEHRYHISFEDFSANDWEVTE